MFETWPRRQFLGFMLGFGLLPVSRSDQPPAKRNPNGLLLPIEPPGPLPSSIYRRLGTLQMRTTSYAHGMSFSPSGKTLVVADRSQLLVYDPYSGNLKHLLKYPPGDVSNGVIDDESMTLLIQRDNWADKFALYTFRLATGQETRYQPLPLTFTRTFVLSPDATLALQTQDAHAICYDCLTGKQLWKIPSGNESHQFFPTSRHALIWRQSEIDVVEARSGKKVITLKAKAGSNIEAMMVGSPDEQWVAAVSARNQDAVSVWNVPSGELTASFKCTGSPLGFSPDSRRLYVPSVLGVQVWDVQAGKVQRELDLGNCKDAKLSPDGQHIANSAGNALWLYGTETGQLKPYSADPPGQPQQLHFVDNNTLQAELNAVNSRIRWSISSGQSTTYRLAKQGGLTQLALTPDGLQAVYQDEKAGLLSVRRLSDGVEVLRSEENQGKAISTPDGLWVVQMPGDRTELYNTRTGKTQRVMGIESSNTIEVTSDGRFAAGISSAVNGNNSDATLTVVEVSTQRILLKQVLPAQPAWLALASNGQRVAVGWTRYSNDVSDDLKGATLIYDSGRIGEVARIKASSNATGDRYCFSSCGRMLTRGIENGIEILECVTGQLRLRLKTGWNLEGLAFSPDRRLLAISGSGGPVWLWDVLGDRTSPAPKLSPDQLPELWTQLAQSDAEQPFQAIRALARRPEVSLPFLDQQIPTTANVSETRIKKLIGELGSSNFKQREAASRELGQLGEAAVPLMEDSLEKSEIDEQRRRLELLLKTHHRAGPEQVRLMRVVEAVEWSGTPAARQLLEKWTQGLYPRPLGREAAAALSRLKLAGRTLP